MESSAIPRLRISVEIFWRSGNRGSKRYTRIFVSTSAATTIEVLSAPSTILRWCRARALVPLPLSRSRQVEAAKTLGRAQCPNLFPGGNDPNHVSRDKPLYLASWANAIAIRHRLWNRDLKLRRYLSHILTIARVSSLFKYCRDIGWKGLTLMSLRSCLRAKKRKI